MLSKNLESSLHRALALAKEHNHEYATLEHLLLALIDDEDAKIAMQGCSVNLHSLSERLKKFLLRWNFYATTCSGTPRAILAVCSLCVCVCPGGWHVVC